MHKVVMKCEALLMTLRSERWRDAAKETIVRSVLKVATGLQVEVNSSEFPSLIGICKENTETLSALLSLAAADLKYTRDEATTNLLKFKEPLTLLAKKTKEVHNADMDSELVVLLARVVRCDPLRARSELGTQAFAETGSITDEHFRSRITLLWY